MSDPRFARLKTDPRFRRIKKEKSKVVVDERFKGIFDDKTKTKGKKGKANVDKYGRPLARDHEQENLRRFYRLEDEDEAQLELKPGPDYARGEVLLESSDEEDVRVDAQSDDDSDSGGIITLGRDVTQPIPVPDDTAEVDLDEDTYAELDAQAAAYAQANPNPDQDAPHVQSTRRIAVVNLDWDHVRAIHLYKIFSSLVSSTGAPLASGSKGGPSKGSFASAVRGKVLSVRVYPSDFGKERMAREEREGPPPEVFKKQRDLKPEEINERTVYETGDGEDYDEEVLRKYQLERLRYYYAIVECDSVEVASHVFNELDGTELERSANVFDLSFVPDDMTFDEDFRDEARDDFSTPYKPLEFVTDALRHSKVKLTWDEDEPERNQITRRVLTRKEIEESDFRAYIASSSSESEAEGTASTSKGKDNKKSKKSQAAERDKLRALLLAGGDDDMPEGWGQGKGGDEDDVDMEITFTPGLSTSKDEKDETTLEKYQRKMREKKKQRKEVRERTKEKDPTDSKQVVDDDFFGANSGEETAAELEADVPHSKKAKGKGKGKKSKDRHAGEVDEETPTRVESTAEELALLAASDNPNGEVKHFNMKAVLRAEKGNKKKRGKKGKKGVDEGDNDLQEDFSIDVRDDRFKAVLEDHTFAIDPSNPHFKKTKSMTAFLEERSRRQQERASKNRESTLIKRVDTDSQQPSLKSLVESVKRKSAAMDAAGVGKRRKLS